MKMKSYNINEVALLCFYWVITGIFIGMVLGAILS